MKVPVHKIVGDVYMTYKDGKRLQREFREAFDRGDTVELDFDKMRIFATAFFNAAVASLLESYSRAELERRLKIVNLPLAAKELLDDSLDNADRSYHDPNFREVRVGNPDRSPVGINRGETQPQLQPAFQRLSSRCLEATTRMVKPQDKCV